MHLPTELTIYVVKIVLWLVIEIFNGHNIKTYFTKFRCKEYVFDFTSIREGTKRTQANTKPSFKRLFTNNEMHFFVFDTKRVNLKMIFIVERHKED